MHEGPILPWDLLNLLVLHYCEPRDSLRMSMTCKRLYNLWSPIERKWLVCGRKSNVLKDIPWEKIDLQISVLENPPANIIDYEFCLKCYALRKHNEAYHTKRKGHLFATSRSLVCLLCRGPAHGSIDCFMKLRKCEKCLRVGPSDARVAILADIVHSRSDGTIYAPVYLFCPKCATEDREMKAKWTNKAEEDPFDQCILQ
jgi:hypothetical protein